jgi:flagellin-specific chaperone FliS
MEQANTAMQNGDYLTARDKAKASLDKTNALIDELKQAISRKAGK